METRLFDSMKNAYHKESAPLLKQKGILEERFSSLVADYEDKIRTLTAKRNVAQRSAEERIAKGEKVKLEEIGQLSVTIEKEKESYNDNREAVELELHEIDRRISAVAQKVLKEFLPGSAQRFRDKITEAINGAEESKADIRNFCNLNGASIGVSVLNDTFKILEGYPETKDLYRRLQNHL